MTKLPEFIHDLPDEQVQPYTVRKQAEYVAIIQWDGGNDQQHWVLIPNAIALLNISAHGLKPLAVFGSSF